MLIKRFMQGHYVYGPDALVVLEYMHTLCVAITPARPRLITLTPLPSRPSPGRYMQANRKVAELTNKLSRMAGLTGAAAGEALREEEDGDHLPRRRAWNPSPYSSVSPACR